MGVRRKILVRRSEMYSDDRSRDMLNSVSLNQILQLFYLGVSIFIVFSLGYCCFFYGVYFVEYVYYFGLDDYISVGMSKWLVITPLILIFSAIMVSRTGVSKKSKMKYDKRFFWLFFLSTLFFMCLLSFSTIVAERYIELKMYTIVLTSALILIVCLYKIKRIPKYYILTMLVLLFTLALSGLVALKDFESVLHRKSYFCITTKEAVYSNDNYIVYGENNNYIFLLEKKGSDDSSATKSTFIPVLRSDVVLSKYGVEKYKLLKMFAETWRHFVK